MGEILNILDIDSMLHIASFLETKDYVNFSSTNKFMSNILRNFMDRTFQPNPKATDSMVFEMARGYMPVIRFASLYGCSNVTDHSVKIISFCTYLQAISLEECDQLTDESIKSLEQCKNLVMINLKYCTSITDNACLSLSKCEKLEIVYLTGTKITDKSLEYLSKCKSLRVLEINGCHNIKTIPYCDFPKLENLSYKFNKLHPTFFEFIKNSSVRDIFLDRCRITNAQVKLLSECTNVTWVSLCMNLITDASIKYLSQMNLNMLDLAYCINLTDKAVEYLADCPNLVYLRLSGCSKLTDQAAKTIANYKKISDVNLSDIPNLTDESAKLLSKNKNIKCVDFSECVGMSDNCKKIMKCDVVFDMDGVGKELNDRYVISDKRLNEKIDKIMDKILG